MGGVNPRAIGWARRQVVGSKMQKLVLLVLASYCTTANDCQVTVQALARDCEGGTLPVSTPESASRAGGPVGHRFFDAALTLSGPGPGPSAAIVPLQVQSADYETPVRQPKTSAPASATGQLAPLPISRACAPAGRQ